MSLVRASNSMQSIVRRFEAMRGQKMIARLRRRDSQCVPHFAQDARRRFLPLILIQ